MLQAHPPSHLHVCCFIFFCVGKIQIVLVYTYFYDHMFLLLLSQAALARLAAAEQCGVTLAVAGRDVPAPGHHSAIG